MNPTIGVPIRDIKVSTLNDHLKRRARELEALSTPNDQLNKLFLYE